MAAVTHRVTTADTGATPNTSGAFTPDAGDLIVVLVSASDTVNDPLTVTLSTGVNLTRIRRETYSSGATGFPMELWVADDLVTAATATSQSVTVNAAGDAATGTNISVFTISSMGWAGSRAVRQSAGQSNQAAATPAPVFASAVLTQNPCIGFIINVSNPAGVSPPASWSEGSDTAYTNPTTGIETASRNSGETGTTITWGSASATGFGSIVAEFSPFPEGRGNQPTNFPIRLPLSLAGLTQLINLMENTLAPVENPFFQTEWPNPALFKQQPINFINSYNESYLHTGEKPHKQDDWPNPLIKGIGKDFIFVRQIERAPDPFFQNDWPNPAPTRSQIIVNISSVNKNEFPRITQEFTLPRQRPLPALTWINNNQEDTLAPVPPVPSIPIDYPNPLLAKKINPSWIQDRPKYYEDTPIRFSQSWPNPLLKIKPAEFWKNNNLQDTLEPPLVALPPSNFIFITPPRKQGLIVGISSSVHIEPTSRPENSQLNWPNPLRKRGMAITWIQERDHYLIDIKPFNQNNWPNPALRKAPAISFIHTRKPDEPPATHPFVLQLANPIIVKRNAVGFSVNVLHYLETIKPIGSSQQDLPSPRRKRETLTWIQPRPFYYPIDISDPFRQVSWPNPELRKAGILVNISTVFPQQASTQKPFKQDQWPNPILRVKRGFSWVDYFIYDSNQPPATQSFDLPLRKRFFDTSYIKTPQAMVAASSDPIKTFDYPNPVIIKRHPHSHIINLLQSTLEPAPGDKPFAQTDYPNPQVAAKIFHSGWLEFKKFYYEEPPIHIGQYDWPIFRAPKRNHVGYIDFRIGTSSPLFTSVTEVPITKKITAITFIDNPALVLNTPASPDAPFRQQDWPIFVRVKNPRDFLGWIHQNTEILPIIKGRAICLLADDTEYNLIAMLEEYGLTAMITEFNLDAGGDKCE